MSQKTFTPENFNQLKVITEKIKNICELGINEDLMNGDIYDLDNLVKEFNNNKIVCKISGVADDVANKFISKLF